MIQKGTPRKKRDVPFLCIPERVKPAVTGQAQFKPIEPEEPPQSNRRHSPLQAEPSDPPITPEACRESSRSDAWNPSQDSMESFHRNVWNQDRGGGRMQPLADAMRGRAAMPYNSQSELIPYHLFESLHHKVKPKSRREPCISSIPQELYIIHSKSGISSLRKYTTCG